LGRDLEGAKITLNDYLDRWLETAVQARVREKTSQDYERYADTSDPARREAMATLHPLDLHITYQRMIERDLLARTVRYTHVVLRSALGQAERWRLLPENPVGGLKCHNNLGTK
jgi:integrase